MEDDYYPTSLQEELNEIMEAFYTLITEDDIKTYQSFLEAIENQKIAEGAVKACSKAPDFELQDQDDETVRLKDLLAKGPVVLVFYRGRWCPACSATLCSMQKILPDIQAKGASLVAISPMLPDGTQVFATKKYLQFPVLSDLGNTVARKYRLTFKVPEEVRPAMEAWGENVPEHNGDCSWEIPLPATYIINTEGDIIWSFIDNDPGCRGEPDDVVAAIPDGTDGTSCKEDDCKCNHDGSKSKEKRKSLKKSVGRLFGKKKQSPAEYISNIMEGG